MSVNINDIITAINSDYLKISNLEALNTLQLESLKNRVLDTIEKVKLITLPIETLNKLNIISFTLNGYIKTLNGIKFSSSGYKNAFEYTPVLNSKKHYSNDTNLITQLSSVNLGKVLGVNKIKQGLIDDVFGYDGKSTLSLSKNTKVPQDRYLHKIKIKDKYSTSFEFRLNRFPVKTYSKKGITKQYSSRRSDLISFNYEAVSKNSDNSISFGAMAPYGVDFSKKIPMVKPNQHPQEYFLKAKYSNSYSPFSIAASITYDNNHKLSVYTDYKFELGKFYDVRLDIELINGSKDFVHEFKTAIDTAILNAEAFSYNGLSFSTFAEAED